MIYFIFQKLKKYIFKNNNNNSNIKIKKGGFKYLFLLFCYLGRFQ